MPRAVARRYSPYLAALRQIALDTGQPVPLRLRACELCLAIRSGHWEIASSRTAQRVIREITAENCIDKELLRLSGLLEELQRQTARIARSVETPAERQAREIDALLEKAEQEKHERENRETENHPS